MAEAFEVATFYAHFDVIEDDEDDLPPTTIRVCDSLTCDLYGANKLIGELKSNLDPQKVRVVRAPCMGLCDKAPACEVGHNHLEKFTLNDVKVALNENHTHPKEVGGIDFDEYVKDGGYQTLRKCYDNQISVDEVIDKLNESGLKGMGGAGFPSGQKWKFVRMEKGPRLMTINGDEGEPGTFKDKLYLESNMHKFFEGMLIAAIGQSKQKKYIFI